MHPKPKANDLAGSLTKQDLHNMEERLIEKMRDMQTEVLHAFHNWARPSEIKSRAHGANIAGLEERISLLEERLNEIGRGPKHQ